MARTRILVEHGKHGEQYYDATTDEQWAAASVAILRDRLDYYIYAPEDPRGHIGDKYADLSTEDVEWAAKEVPADLDPELAKPLQKKIDKAKAKVHRVVSEYESANAAYNEVKRIVEENDLSMITVGRNKWARQEPLAWQLVESRSDGEYERVSTEFPVDATKES